MSIPLQRGQVLKGAAWIRHNFATAIAPVIIGTQITFELIQAIACKETHNIWLPRIDTHAAKDLIPLCIGDASGDVPGTIRKAFPVNAAAFREKFGDDFTKMLISEANKARALRGLGPDQFLYKGYGIFQYDLQHVLTDAAFFRDRQWHSIDKCAEKLVLELNKKFKASGGDVRGAVRRYNGSGPAAEQYADHVMQFLAWCQGKS